MRTLQYAIWGTMLLTIFGCATRNDLANLQQDLDEMKNRTLRVEKDLGEIRSETREGLDRNLKGFQGDIDALRKTTADIQANQDSSKVDVQLLAGKVDDLAQQVKKPAEELALLREDSGKRQGEIEGRLKKVEKGIEELQKLAAELKSHADEKTPDAIYQRGIDAHKSGDYQKAHDQFTRFLELFPNHELTANAHYWLGETYYSQKVYDTAIVEFEEVVKKFPSKGKAPAALLKQGMAFAELGDPKSARFVYKKLIDNYPLADEVKVAKEKLKELK